MLRLKPREDRRLRQGHPWVYSNEIDVRATPLTGFSPGEAVQLQAASGEALGLAYVNPASLICARRLGSAEERVLDREWLTRKLNAAAALRDRLFPNPFYRLVFGESDGLPGLVVDRYGDILVVQISTAGMDRLEALVVSVLCERFAPRGILLRNDIPSRDLEGLPRFVRVAHGDVPEEIHLEEGGCRFSVPLLNGQKTGWFYDQRGNRARLRPYVAGARVLDLYSYVGAWGILAAHAGAASVLCVDSSAPALSRVARNAEQNGLAAKVTTAQADVPEFLQRLRDRKERFDVVLLDPPAFIRRRKDIAEGVAAYRRVNQMAAAVLSADGYLVTSSCSYHLQREVLLDAVLRAGRRYHREVQILEEGGQAPDHPVHPALPETAYLKTVFARLSSGFSN